MTHCGLDHIAKYREHHDGHLPGAKTIQRINSGCDAWYRQLTKASATPSVTTQDALEKHAIVGRFWDMHLADMGAANEVPKGFRVPFLTEQP